MSFGIYTLGNDAVYDQVVALLNSIDVNVGNDIPVCVIPYNDQVTKLKQNIGQRPNVTMYKDENTLNKWESFARNIWESYPQASQKGMSRLISSKIPLQRKMAAFSGDFDKFVFYDADTLAMKPLDDIWSKLDVYDFVFDDWEHCKKPITALDIPAIEATGEFTEAEIRPQLHCSSFFGSKRGLWSDAQIKSLENKLIHEQEVNWLNGVADAFLFSYLTFRANFSTFNYTLSEKSSERTGNCADADPFVNKNNILYNQQGLKPIHRIHYMNYSSADFARLTQGEDVDIPHQDVFLHYRFLKNPHQKPTQLVRPNLLKRMHRLRGTMFKKIRKLVR